MGDQQKFLLILGLAFVATWDTATTYLGTASFLTAGRETEAPTVLLSLLFACLLTALLVYTVQIMYHPDTDDLFILGFKALWILALAYDLLTSFQGNREYVIPAESGNILQLVMLLGVTIFVSSSPIIISFLVFRVDLEDEKTKEPGTPRPG